MNKRTVWLIAILLLLAAGAAAQSAADLIAQADGHYAGRGDPAQARQALAKYRQALQAEPGNYEALWKAAKTIFTVGKSLASDKERLALFGEGIALAKRAVAANPGGAEGHFWLGVCWGRYGETRGVLKSLFLADDIKREMRQVLAIDENYEGAGAHRLLGRVYFKLPGIAGGSNRKALVHLERAARLCPGDTLNLIYLAELYWDEGRKAEAVRTLEQLLAAEPDPRWLPETEEDRAEARRLLKKYRR